MTTETRSVSGNVYIDSDVVGSISGQYVDEYQDENQQDIKTRSIDASVVIDNSSVGSGTISYDDYVAYDNGGSRNNTVTGNVYIDNDSVGDVVFSYLDEYGKVVSKIPTHLTLVVEVI